MVKRASTSEPLGVSLLGLARELKALKRKRAELVKKGEARIAQAQADYATALHNIDLDIAKTEAVVIAAVKTDAPMDDAKSETADEQQEAFI